MGALVIHGFTGSPQSMRPLAEAFAAAGFTVELPALPGHGTSIEDMLTTSWAGLVLGRRSGLPRARGALRAGRRRGALDGRHADAVAGDAASRDRGNRADQRRAADRSRDVAQVRAAIEAGAITTDAVGGDVADPGAVELAYDRTPLRPLASLFDALDALRDRLADIHCPALVVVSEQDHIVPPANSEQIAAALAGPVEKLVLQRSFHVATIDYDKALIAERAIAFARRVCGVSPVGAD